MKVAMREGGGSGVQIRSDKVSIIIDADSFKKLGHNSQKIAVDGIKFELSSHGDYVTWEGKGVFEVNINKHAVEKALVSVIKDVFEYSNLELEREEIKQIEEAIKEMDWEVEYGLMVDEMYGRGWVRSKLNSGTSLEVDIVETNVDVGSDMSSYSKFADYLFTFINFDPSELLNYEKDTVARNMFELLSDIVYDATEISFIVDEVMADYYEGLDETDDENDIYEEGVVLEVDLKLSEDVTLPKGTKVKVIREELSKDQVKLVVDSVKEIYLKGGEVSPSVENRMERKSPFKSLEEAEAFVELWVERPSVGYTKIKVKVILEDGFEITGWRYDHGPKDSAFAKQFEEYVAYALTITED